MTKQLYIIQYDSAHWCGGESHCVVWAHSPEDALDEASEFMEEHMRELFSGEYDEAYNDETESGFYDDESAVSVDWVELFGPDHDHWQYFERESQSDYYPVIGSPE